MLLQMAQNHIKNFVGNLFHKLVFNVIYSNEVNHWHSHGSVNSCTHKRYIFSTCIVCDSTNNTSFCLEELDGLG